MEDGVWVVVGKKGKNVNCYEIGYKMKATPEVECRMIYWRTKMITELVQSGVMLPLEEVKMVADENCLLLPFLRHNCTFKKDYSIVFSDWDVLGRSWEKELPTYCEMLFQR